PAILATTCRFAGARRVTDPGGKICTNASLTCKTWRDVRAKKTGVASLPGRSLTRRFICREDNSPRPGTGGAAPSGPEGVRAGVFSGRHQAVLTACTTREA